MESIKLGEVITDIATGPFGSNLKVSCFVDDGFPIVDGANLKGYKLTDNITKYVTEEKARSLKRSIAKRNDIVATISGTVGQISYIPEDSKYEEYLCSQRQFRASFDTSRVYVPYLVFYFHTYEGQHKILLFANQVGVPALAQPLKNFRLIDIDLPDLETQKKIASVIESINNKIEKNEAINKNLVEQVFALYDNTFPRMEGPSCRADEFFNITIGKTPPRKEPEWFSEESINTKWVSISDMGSCGLYISDSSEYLVPEAVSKFNVVVVPDNTVLLSFKLTVGRVAITDGIMTTNEAIAHFKTDKKEINPYLYCYLKRFNFQTLGSTSSIATAINSKIVKAMPFVIPSDTDLAQFNEVALPAFEMIKLNLRENRSLAATRDLLLPKLMSGEIDVSDLSI